MNRSDVLRHDREGSVRHDLSTRIRSQHRFVVVKWFEQLLFEDPFLFWKKMSLDSIENEILLQDVQLVPLVRLLSIDELIMNTKINSINQDRSNWGHDLPPMYWLNELNYQFDFVDVFHRVEAPNIQLAIANQSKENSSNRWFHFSPTSIVSKWTFNCRLNSWIKFSLLFKKKQKRRDFLKIFHREICSNFISPLCCRWIRRKCNRKWWT